MTNTSKIECLTLLAKIQEMNRTAPIQVSIGFTDEKGFVNDDFIVLKECPPIVIEKLIQNKYMLSLTKQGLIIDKFNTGA